MPILIHPTPIPASTSPFLEPPQCRLSDKSQALVTMYTAILTTIVSTFANSYEECIYVAILSWVPFTRATVGVFLNTVRMLNYIQSPERAAATSNQEDTEEAKYPSSPDPMLPSLPQALPPPARAKYSASWLQHLQWWWGHAYYPLSQTFWFARNFTKSTPLNLAARGTAIGAQLVVLSFDPRARAIRSVAGRCTWGFIIRFMSALSLVSRITLACFMFREYIAAVLGFSTRTRTIALAVCVPCSAVLCYLSYATAGDDYDEDSDWVISNTRLFVGIVLATFAGGFPLMVVVLSTDKNGLSISEYVKCSSATTWEKVQGIAF
jgi:hypothetical protein